MDLVSAREAAGTAWLCSATLAADGAVWWQEIRPGEGGRGQLLRTSAGGHVTDMPGDRDGIEPGLLLPLSGGAMVAASDRDGRRFLLAPGARPRPVTMHRASGGVRVTSGCGTGGLKIEAQRHRQPASGAAVQVHLDLAGLCRE